MTGYSRPALWCFVHFRQDSEELGSSSEIGPRVPTQPQTHYTAKANFNFWTALPLPPERQGYICASPGFKALLIPFRLGLP